MRKNREIGIVLSMAILALAGLVATAALAQGPVSLDRSAPPPLDQTGLAGDVDTGENDESDGDAASRFGPAGVVYTMSNQMDGNRVIVFERSHGGALWAAGSFPTGGFGTGGGLGNQGGVALTQDGRRLLTVNAGSNELSVFEVDGRRLVLTDIVPSGGERPVSVTCHEGVVYVLNAMGAGSITGFSLGDEGRLTPLAGSTQPLSGAQTTAAAQIQFNPAGDQLVVTEKATQTIDTFAVDAAGLAGPPRVNPTDSPTPFGFGFTRNGQLIVSEAVGGAEDASVVSSYGLGADGALSAISPSVPTNETAACWIVVTRDSRFAYTTNTGSGSISGYAVNPHTAELALLDPDGITAMTGPGSSPIDMALSRNSRLLFVLNSGTHEIVTFRVNRFNGRLTYVGSVGGLPDGTNGLAAR